MRRVERIKSEISTRAKVVATGRVVADERHPRLERVLVVRTSHFALLGVVFKLRPILRVSGDCRDCTGMINFNEPPR